MSESEIAQVLAQVPLRQQASQLARHMVRESARTGVPAWLMLAQMEFETSMGSTVNCTVQRNRQIRVGNVTVRTGCAYNLFNITTPNLQTGEYLKSGTGIIYRAYRSFEESITDYCNLLARAYRDLRCWDGGRSFIEKYFPLWQNGRARQREYFTTLARGARRWGKIGIDETTVLLPSSR